MKRGSTAGRRGFYDINELIECAVACIVAAIIWPIGDRLTHYRAIGFAVHIVCFVVVGITLIRLIRRIRG